jgi:hypothetical protein
MMFEGLNLEASAGDALTMHIHGRAVSIRDGRIGIMCISFYFLHP